MFVMDATEKVQFDIQKLKDDLEAISKMVINEEFRCSFVAKQSFNILKSKSIYKTDVV